MTASPTSKYATAFIFVTVFLDMVGFGLIMPVLPRLIETVGHMDVAGAAMIGGWMFFVFSIAQFICGPAMGNLSDAFGRRPMLLLAVFGLFVDYLIMSFAPDLFWLFIGRAFAGVCGASYVIANAYIADVTPHEGRAKAFGMMGAAFGLGFVIGPALGGLLGEFGTRVPFHAAAAIAGLNLIYGYLVLPETLPLERRRRFEWLRANPLGTFKVFRTYPGMLPLCAVFFAFTFASSVYPAIWPFWSIARFGWSELVIGLTLAAFGIITAIFQGVLTGPVVKLLGENNTLLAGLISAAIAAAGYGLAPGMAVVIILFVIHGPEGFVQPMMSAIMSKMAPEDAQGELQGGLSSMMSVAMMLGTLFFSQVFSHFMRADSIVSTPSMALYVAAALLVCTLMLFLAVRRKLRRPSAGSPV